MSEAVGDKSVPQSRLPAQGYCASAHRRFSYSSFGRVPSEPSSASSDNNVISNQTSFDDQPMARSEVTIRYKLWTKLEATSLLAYFRDHSLHGERGQ
jgi:hypothetical protein